MTEVLSGGREKAGCYAAELWFRSLPGKTKQDIRLTNGRRLNVLQDDYTRK